MIGISLNHWSLHKNKEETINFFQTLSISNAEALSNELSQELDKKINDIRFFSFGPIILKELKDSNQRFNSIDDQKKYSQEIQNDLQRYNDTNSTNLFEEIKNNEGSERLMQIQDFYIQYPENRQLYPEISIYNKYGALVSSTTDTVNIMPDNDQCYNIAKEKGIYINFQKNMENKEIDNILICSSIGSSNNFSGVIRTILDFKIITDIINACKINYPYNSTKILIISQDKKIIYDSEDDSDTNILSKYLEDIDLNNNTEFFETKEKWNYLSEDKGIFITSSRLNITQDTNNLNWTIVIINQKNEVLKHWESLSNQIIIISFITFFLMIVSAYLLSTFITNPLYKLKKNADQIIKGNYAINPDINSKDEIEILSDAINVMAANIVEYKKTLKNLEKQENKDDKKLSEDKDKKSKTEDKDNKK